MQIGVEKTVHQNLLEIGAEKLFGERAAIEFHSGERAQVRDLFSMHVLRVRARRRCALSEYKKAMGQDLSSPIKDIISHEKFDAITSDLLDSWVKGTAMLYTKEFFELAKSKLNPGGTVTVWVNINESTPAAVKSEIASFFEAFLAHRLTTIATCAFSTLAGLGLNRNEGDKIYADILQYNKFPEGLFTGSEGTMTHLRTAVENAPREDR